PHAAAGRESAELRESLLRRLGEQIIHQLRCSVGPGGFSRDDEGTRRRRCRIGIGNFHRTTFGIFEIRQPLGIQVDTGLELPCAEELSQQSMAFAYNDIVLTDPLQILPRPLWAPSL